MSNELTITLTVRFAQTLLTLAFAFGPVLSPLAAQTTPFAANDRVQLLPINHSLRVAESNEIPIRITNPNVKSIIIDWGIYRRPGSPSPEYANEAKNAEYSLLPGTSIVHFTPSVIGKLKIIITAFFLDGGFARKDEEVETVLPDQPPEKFIFPKSDWTTWNQNRRYAIVNQTVWLDTVAYYPGFDKPIHLPTTDIAFHVLNYPGREPLQLDPATGIIKPVAAGRALVQADFAGLTTFTCVIVFSSGPGGPNQDCNDLLPPGKSMPPEEPLGTPPQVRALPRTNR